MRVDLRVVAHALGGGCGLLIMGYAAQTYFWYGYQQATPTGGAVSTSPGFTLVTAALFLAGTVVAFSAFATGLAHVLADES